MRACNERVQSLLRLSTDFFWETDSQHRFTRFDRDPRQTSAFPSEGPIGKTRWELPHTRPDEAGWRAHREILERHIPFRDFEFARPLPDGTERHLRISGEPIFAADGSFLGYRGVGHDVTELKLAEAALRGSETRFRSLAQLSSDWYWEQDEQFRFSFLSGGYQAITGLDPALLLGRKRWDWQAPNLTEEDWARHRVKLERHEPFFDFEIQRTVGRGHTRWLSISGVPILGENGRFYGYRGVGRDITPRKRMRQLLALEHAAARCLADADKAAEALKAVIRSVCESESWDLGRYFRVDDEGLRLEDHWSVPGAGFEKHIEGSPAACPLGTGLEARLLKTGKPQWSTDAASDHRVMTTALARESGLHGAFMFAVTFKGKPIGVLAFNSREIREPDAGLLQTARVIGGQLGQFLTRKHAEEEQRKSEERFRSLTLLTSDTYWEQDDQYRFALFSGSGQEWVDASGRRALGKRRWEMDFLNMTPAGWKAHIAVCEAHLPFQDLELCRIEAGTKLWISVSGAPVFDASGAFTGYRGVGKDISARKRAQQLRELEHAVADCLGDADNAQEALKAVIRAICETESWDCGRYFRADDQAGVLRFDDAWGVPGAAIDRFIEGSRALVYPLGAGLTGRAWLTGEPLWSADTTSDPRVLGAALARESGIRGAFTFPVTSEGTAIGVLSFNSREVREPDKALLQTIRAIGGQIGQFLTRKRAQDELRQSEERFRSLTGLMSDGYWELDEEFRFSFLSPGIEKARLVCKDLLGKRPWECEAVHATPERWSALQGDLHAHRPFQEFVFTRPASAGEELYFSISGLPTFDTEGRFTGYRGLARDITEKMRSQERVEYLAYHDELTGLRSRSFFVAALARAIEQARRAGRRLALVFIDLDDFKEVNDTYGHASGDRVLKEIAERLTASFRKGDLIARLGGDEFVVLIEDSADRQLLGAIANKVLAEVVRPCATCATDVRVTASIGISVFPDDAEDESGLIQNADAAMYRAKAKGKNVVGFFSAAEPSEATPR